MNSRYKQYFKDMNNNNNQQEETQLFQNINNISKMIEKPQTMFKNVKINQNNHFIFNMNQNNEQGNKSSVSYKKSQNLQKLESIINTSNATNESRVSSGRKKSTENAKSQFKVRTNVQNFNRQSKILNQSQGHIKSSSNLQNIAQVNLSQENSATKLNSMIEESRNLKKMEEKQNEQIKSMNDQIVKQQLEIQSLQSTLDHQKQSIKQQNEHLQKDKHYFKKIEDDLEHFLDESQWKEGELTYQSFIQKLLSYLEKMSNESMVDNFTNKLQIQFNKFKFITLTMIQHNQNIQNMLDETISLNEYQKKYEFLYEQEKNQKTQIYLKYQNIMKKVEGGQEAKKCIKDLVDENRKLQKSIEELKRKLNEITKKADKNMKLLYLIRIEYQDTLKLDELFNQQDIEEVQVMQQVEKEQQIEQIEKQIQEQLDDKQEIYQKQIDEHLQSMNNSHFTSTSTIVRLEQNYLDDSNKNHEKIKQILPKLNFKKVQLHYQQLNQNFNKNKYIPKPKNNK